MNTVELRKECTMNDNRSLGISSPAIPIVFVLALLFLMLLAPDLAFADDPPKGVNLTSMIASLKNIVTIVLLPIGILVAGWRIIYLGVFCAMAGIDPLDIMDGGRNSDGSVSAGEAVAAIKQHLGGFAKGLAWVGGIWLVFQLALTVAQMLATGVAAL